MNSLSKFILVVYALTAIIVVVIRLDKIEKHMDYIEKYFRHQELIDMELDSTIFEIDSLYDRRNSIDSIESCTPDSN